MLKYYLVGMFIGMLYLAMFESIFTSSYIGRMLIVAAIIQAENLLYRFANFNKPTQIITFILKLVYVGCRVAYEFRGQEVVLMSYEDLPQLVAFTSFFTYTVYIDDRVSQFIFDTFL